MNFGDLLYNYIPLIISNVIVIVFFVFFKKNKEKETELHKNEVSKLEAQALRQQMNPHFIYNALNSVQSVMILKGEREFNRYIGMLSKLLRFTLEINTYEKITLKEEIEYLEAYIGLQKMRMDPEIEFKMTTNLNQEAAAYLIPPMLIQPVVENAIIHGLSPLKNKKGVLHLTFTDKNKSIQIRVEDNGIGYETSRQKKNKAKALHKSMATKIMKERIDIFNYLDKNKTSFSIYSKKEKNKEVGTIAHLEIPYN
jgi:sensor histidine kinase YesM